MSRVATGVLWTAWSAATGWFVPGYLAHIGVPNDVYVAGCIAIVCFNGALAATVIR